MKTYKNIGSKSETKDGAFTRWSLRHKDGWNRKAARRRINKRIRKFFKMTTDTAKNIEG